MVTRRLPPLGNGFTRFAVWAQLAAETFNVGIKYSCCNGLDDGASSLLRFYRHICSLSPPVVVVVKSEQPTLSG